MDAKLNKDDIRSNSISDIDIDTSSSDCYTFSNKAQIGTELDISATSISNNQKQIKITDFLLLTILPICICTIYLLGVQQSKNYNAIHFGETLSQWYWIGATIRSLFGFAVNVVWPYVICHWISMRYGICLTLYCSGLDSALRLNWFFNKTYFYNNEPEKKLFLLFWAAMNDINTFFVVPICVYYVHTKQKTKIKTKFWYQQMNDMGSRKHSINESLLPPKQKYYKLFPCNNHFTKISVLYIIVGLWFTIQDCYQYHESIEYSAFVRLPPVLCVALVFIWELYGCKVHKKIRFVHYSLMCLFIPVQQLYFDWTYLVVQLNEWSVVNNLSPNITQLIIFIGYTIYFQFISFIGYKLCEHVSITIKNVFELNFIFIFYAEMFLTIYVSLSITFDWTIFVMIFVKMIIKIVKFDHRIIKHIPYYKTKKIKLAQRYLYSLLSTIYVFIGRNVLLIIDYMQTSDNGSWMLSQPKTQKNLLMSMLILFITFIGQCVAYFMVCWMDQKQNYSWKTLRLIPINVAYFCVVIAMSQIFALFLPWWYAFQQ